MASGAAVADLHKPSAVNAVREEIRENAKVLTTEDKRS
jgi:hypothetical protein